MISNPFSTRFFQPGAIPFRRFDGGSVTELAKRILALPQRRASIIGPHGSGKSTLIASLIPEFARLAPDMEVYHLRFSSNDSPSSSIYSSLVDWRASSLVILDGYEQLKLWSRIKIAWTARMKSIQILATAHRTIPGFLTLWETSVSQASSQWVVEQLLQGTEIPDAASQLLESTEWEASRFKHGQNLRESLFDMYDWWQEQCGTAVPAVIPPPTQP